MRTGLGRFAWPALACLALVLSCTVERRPPGIDPRIAAVEHGLLPQAPASWDEGYDLRERMRHYGVPGVSIAVIDDFELAWTRGYGVADGTTGEPVTERTLFQAGSISKPVAATGAMVQVEAGRLSLDAPINDALRSWKLPDGEKAGAAEVTLRRLLSHTAGTTVHGFPGYPPGRAVPTLVEVLDGRPPANTSAVRVTLEPGAQVRYSGGGTTIVQLALSDVTGTAFPELMRRTVLEPLRMDDSTFEQPLPAERDVHAASGHRISGRVVEGRHHVYPEMAAAGLWTTSGDLARFACGLMRAFGGRSDHPLGSASLREMFEPVRESAGLGFFVESDEGTTYVSHGGADEGFQAHLVFAPATGQGVAVMTNSDLGSRLATEIIQAVAASYDWPGRQPKPVEAFRLAAERLDAYTGRYLTRPDHLMTVRREGDRLSAGITGLPPAWLVPVGDHVFVSQDDGQRLRFVMAGDGRAGGYVLADRSGEPERPRLDDTAVHPAELFEAARWDEALRLYSEVAREDPARVNRAALYFLDVIDTAHAIDILKVNAEAHPEDANLWDSLAFGYRVAGDRGHAAEAYAKVLDAMPRYKPTNPDLAARLEAEARVWLALPDSKLLPYGASGRREPDSAGE